MPKFDFFCKACGLMFEKLVQEAKVQETPCKSCGVSSARYFKPHNIGVTYKGGLPPTATIDQIVGSDAEKRWGTVNKLHADANTIRKSSNVPVVEVGATGQLQTPNAETLQTRRDAASSIVNPQSNSSN